MVHICRDFSWCPTDNMIAYWVPEAENVPARVTIIAMPSRKELCIRNLFSVADCRMHWQKNGDYLCVKVDRYSKSRKNEETGQMKYSVSFVTSYTLDRGGSEVECLTQDRGAAGSSLTGVTALCP